MRKARGTGSTAGADIHAAALALAARGWSVIPIEPCGKRPLVPWLEFQQRRANSEEIEEWFHRWPDANVGIVTGRVSGLAVIDIDPRHGGAASLARAQDEHGPLPRTVEAETGGGGRHLYFAHAGESLRNRVGILPGIDLRADGGCVVAPPSMHPSGRRYLWAAGCAPDDVPLAAAPRWLLPAAHDGEHRGHPLAHWRELVRQDVAEGTRNSTLASLAGHLLWHGVDPQVTLELLLAFNRARCRPPLPDEEVAQVVTSIARLHEREPGE
jgi:Bifunctional DNA primase/polymerase, N-terminal/Primase C terminal 1 (PriCT-1)